MGAIRATAVGILILLGVAAAADDCISETRTISTRSSSPNLVAGPSSWSGSILGVAKVQESSPLLWFNVYSGSLDPLSSDQQIASNGAATNPLVGVAWTGTEFGVLYRTTGQGLSLQRVSTTGAPVGVATGVTAGRPVANSDRIAFAWNDVLDAYVVVRIIAGGTNRGVWLTLFDAAGGLLSDRQSFVFAETGSNVALGITETGVMGVFYLSAGNSLMMSRFEGTGPSQTLSIASGGSEIRVTSRNGLFVVVRSVADGPGTVLRWLVVDTSHQLVRADSLFLQGTGAEIQPRGLISNGTELALSYLDSPVIENTSDDIFRLIRFTIDGVVLSDDRFSGPQIGLGKAVSPFPFHWTGESYVTPAVWRSSDRLSSYLFRYCPLIAKIVGPRGVAVGSTVKYVAAASGGVPGYTYGWRYDKESRDQLGIESQRKYTTPGTHTVTLKVTDLSGNVVTITETFVVGYPRRRAARH